MQDLAQVHKAFEPETLVGTVLDGRYELVAHLATGGMGAVFRARDAHLRKDVAVKVLRPDLSATLDFIERFRMEAEISSALEHENIVRVTDFGRSADGYLYFVMELLTGESLFDRLRREVFLPPEEAVPILWQVCAGLEAAHAVGVVHRDLKPENLFLARTTSGREVTKILDFGIAKITYPASGTGSRAGMLLGTPGYLSPEQATGSTVDARADIYAVGLIAWQMLGGRHPFKADDTQGLLMMQATQAVPALIEQRPGLAEWPALVSAVTRACAKDRTQRPQAAVLKDELAATLGPAFVWPLGRALQLPPKPPWSQSFDFLSPERPNWWRELTLATDLSTPRAWLKAATHVWVEAIQLACAAGRVIVSEGSVLARRAVARARARSGFAVSSLVAIVTVAAFVAVPTWQHSRPAADARRQLAAGNAIQARVILDAALAPRPHDHELLLLSGHALHRIPGAAAEGIDAYQAARLAGPLDADALRDLAGDLGRERGVADRAARVLREVGQPAIPAVKVTAGEGAGFQRLRALTLLRDLGAEDQVDRAWAYGRLLGDPDCEVRCSAARRLGEIGTPAALPQLRNAAQLKVEKKGFLGIVTRPPACGAVEAAEAARRIEAAQ